MTIYPANGKNTPQTQAQIEDRYRLPGYFDPLKNKPLFLTPLQVEERCGISRKTLEVWRRRGGGPRFVWVSARKVLYSLEELTAWLDARTVRSTSEPMGLES